MPSSDGGGPVGPSGGPRGPGGRFPKSARLALSSEFARVRTEGKSIAGRYLIMGVYRSGQDEAARTGLITSRRVGNAVLRNRVRRRLREIVRLERANLRPGHWVVLVARAAAAKTDSARLRAEYLALGRRGAIFQPGSSTP